MSEQRDVIRPENFEEKMVWYYATWTYPLFFLGLQPVGAPIVGWVLALYAGFKMWSQTDETPEADKIKIPFGVWVWIICLGILEVALVMAHVDFNLGYDQIIRSSVNTFLKVWFLFALLPLAGACLKIRPQVLCRAVAILCVQSLIVIILAKIFSVLKLPLPEYSPPLGAIGGGGYVSLLSTDSFLKETRMSLFAPWAPALGLVGTVYVCVTYLETNLRWRIFSIAGAVAMLVASGSRTGQVCLVLVPGATLLLSYISRPIVQIGTGIASLFVGIFGPQLYQIIRNRVQELDQQRAASSKTRKMLLEITLHRWRTDAFLWGHGRPATGPLVTTYKPLGSHNTWGFLLFCYGIVGAVAFGVALAWSFLEFFIKAQQSRIAQGAMGVVMSLVIYMATENIDYLVFLHWPGLVLMGMAFKEKYPRLQLIPSDAPEPEAQPTPTLASADASVNS